MNDAIRTWTLASEKLSECDMNAVGSDGVEILVLWRHSHLRCVLAWIDERYRLRLLRGDTVLREEASVDDAVLIAIARRWRREYDSGHRHDQVANGDPGRRDSSKATTPPPCIYCGADGATDVTPLDVPKTHRWYRCG